MSDDTVTLTLDHDLAVQLAAAADAAGRPLAAFAREILSEAIALPDQDWSEDLARVAAYERTGKAIPAAPALARFRDAVAARPARRR